MLLDEQVVPPHLFQQYLLVGLELEGHHHGLWAPLLAQRAQHLGDLGDSHPREVRMRMCEQATGTTAGTCAGRPQRSCPPGASPVEPVWLRPHAGRCDPSPGSANHKPGPSNHNPGRRAPSRAPRRLRVGLVEPNQGCCAPKPRQPGPEPYLYSCPTSGQPWRFIGRDQVPSRACCLLPGPPALPTLLSVMVSGPPAD